MKAVVYCGYRCSRTTIETFSFSQKEACGYQHFNPKKIYTHLHNKTYWTPLIIIMIFVQFFIVLWACSTALGAAGPPFKRVDPWEVTQKYCGELLQASIKIVCKGRSQKITVAEFQKQEINKFIINACCTKECNLRFIEAHCPEKRTKSHKVNSSTIPAGTPTPVPVHKITSTTTTTTSTTTSTTTQPPPTTPSTPATQESHGLWYYILLPLHNPFYSNFYLP